MGKDVVASVSCTTCREAVSARLDGEQEPIPASVTDHHLEHCVECRQWRTQATALSRELKVRPVYAMPDFTTTVLPTASLKRPRRWPRVALAVIGALQILLGLTQLFGVDAYGAMSGHLFNESTAWNLALGIGLLWAAIRTRATSGLLPVLAGFLGVLTVFCVLDLLSGAVLLSRVATHGLLVAGLAALVIVHRQRRHGGSPSPADSDRRGWHDTGSVTEEPEMPAPQQETSPHPDLRPASQYRAA